MAGTSLARKTAYGILGLFGAVTAGGLSGILPVNEWVERSGVETSLLVPEGDQQDQTLPIEQPADQGPENSTDAEPSIDTAETQAEQAQAGSDEEEAAVKPVEEDEAETADEASSPEPADQGPENSTDAEPSTDTAETQAEQAQAGSEEEEVAVTAVEKATDETGTPKPAEAAPSPNDVASAQTDAPSSAQEADPTTQQTDIKASDSTPLDLQTGVAALDVTTIIPTFDLLRVEPDGSVLIAGSASANARIEAYAGSRLLGETRSGASGQFVIVFDDALAPGDYEIVLRADAPDGISATSTETAIVSVPQEGNDGVLALVEAPGEPSRLISAGQGTAQPLEAVEPEPEPTQIADEPAEATEAVEESASEAPQDQPESTTQVRIEAVEIDGSQLFIAGTATPGSRLNVYANEVLLGTTTASPDGQFLVETNRELSVGDYMIRADELGDNGADVVQRAAVPFVREPGEQLAAIAVQEPVRLPDAPSVVHSDDSSATSAKQSDDEQGARPESAETVDAEPEAQTDTATAEAVNTQPALQPVERSIIIRRGDTLWQISRRIYGKGIRYTTIYEANTDQIRDPDRIWPGQIFAVPEEEAE